jgi:hypothetical protein
MYFVDHHTNSILAKFSFKEFSACSNNYFLMDIYNCIGGVMVSVLASSVVDRVYKIGICCFSTKHAAMRRKSKDGLAQYQDVSEWGNMSIHRLLFQWASTIKIQLSVLILYKVDLIIISLKINLLSPWYSWNIAELALNNNQQYM